MPRAKAPDMGRPNIGRQIAAAVDRLGSIKEQMEALEIEKKDTKDWLTIYMPNAADAAHHEGKTYALDIARVNRVDTAWRAIAEHFKPPPALIEQHSKHGVQVNFKLTRK